MLSLKRVIELFKNRIKQVNRKHLLFILIFAVVLIVGFPTVTYAASDPPNWGEKILSGMVRAFAEGLNKILTAIGRPIDRLVYNMKGTDFDNTMGLTILDKNSAVSQYIFGVYKNIQWLAAVFFVPMGLWIAVDFVRAQDNSQKRAVLKERLLKFVLTFILLTSMPIVLDMMFALNDAIVTFFRGMGLNAINNTNFNSLNGGLLVSQFQQKANEEKTLLFALIYLMSTFLNVWMLFYYMVRDITISFLLLLFPIISIFYPFKRGMVANWFKEMAANIYTQAIHAGILSIVLGLAYKTDSITAITDSTLYQSLFILVAFGATIPMTGVAKRFLQLEGSVGGGATLAGVGAMMGAFTLAKGATNSIKGGIANFKEGKAELADLKSHERLQDKGAISSSVSSGKLSSVESKPLSSVNQGIAMSQDEMDMKKTQATRKMLSGAAGLAGAGYVGSMMGIGASVFGLKGAAAGAMTGTVAGETLGSKGVAVGYDKSIQAAHWGADKLFGEGIRPKLKDIKDGNVEVFQGKGIKDTMNNAWNNAKNMGSNLAYNADEIIDKALDDDPVARQDLRDETTGLGGDVLYGTDFKAKEEKAVLAYKKQMLLGNPDKAWREYAKHTPKRSSKEELEKLIKEGQLQMYRDKDMSVAYSQSKDEEGNIIRKVHWTGKGNPELTSPITEKVHASMDGSLDASPERQREINDIAKKYAMTINPDVKSSQYNQAFHSKYNELMSQNKERTLKIRSELGINIASVDQSPTPYTPVPRTNTESVLRRELEVRDNIKETLELQKQKLDEMMIRYGQTGLNPKNEGEVL